MFDTSVHRVFEVILTCCIVLLLSCWGVTTSSAATVDTLKQVEKSLRAGERDMFNGKTEKAIESLDNIQKMLGQARQEDPANPKLKLMEKKFQKLVKDLERRTGKDLGGGTLTARTTSTASSLPDTPDVKPVVTTPAGSASVSTSPSKQAVPTSATTVSAPAKKAGKLPYAARRPFDQASRGLKNIETLFNQFENVTDNDQKGSLVSRLNTSMGTIENDLAEAQKLAAEKGVTSHPSFDEAERQLASLRKRVHEVEKIFAGEVAQAREQAGQIESDVDKLKEVYDRLKPIIDKATGTTMYYNDLAPVYPLLDQIKDFEVHDRDALSVLIDEFGGKYGTSESAIDQKAAKMGYVGEYYSASYHFLALKSALENIDATRKVMAEDLARRAGEIVQRAGKTHDFYLLAEFEKAQEYLTLADQFDKGNRVVADLTASVERQVSEGIKEFGKKIDSQKWPGHGTQAPPHVDSLARTAKKWFEDSPDWGSREKDPYAILAVAITGPWSVQKKNILGEVIMYGLPVLVAVQNESDRKNSIARVFSLTLRTLEKRGVTTAPPFDYATVGSSYYIRPKAL